MYKKEGWYFLNNEVVKTKSQVFFFLTPASPPQTRRLSGVVLSHHLRQAGQQKIPEKFLRQENAKKKVFF
jgi:hypothetical protein